MVQNVERLLERGEKIELLVNRAESLTEQVMCDVWPATHPLTLASHTERFVSQELHQPQAQDVVAEHEIEPGTAPLI